MTLNTVLLVILSLLIAGGLSFFQYYYKAKNKSKVYLFLAFLRFLTLFGVLLLLVNPIVTKNKLEIVKPKLALVMDNSSSIKELHADKIAKLLYEKIFANQDLKEKFDLQSYSFDRTLESSDAFTFEGKQSNMDVVAKNLKAINRNEIFPTVLITDGNQTTGNDYLYSFDEKNKVYPIILGDTTKVFDLKISQLNVNKYAFYKNKFPVEIFIDYSGSRSTAATFTITQGKEVVNKQTINFSKGQKTATVQVLLDANKIGSQLFKATISSKEKEINTYNNVKNFAVEVLDQKTNVAIVTAINHPDVAALKRAIESNAQRKVSIFNLKEVKSIGDFGVVIFYQPTAQFKKIMEQSRVLGANSLIVTGTHTDFALLNTQQNSLNFAMSNQKEDYLASFNKEFNLFSTENLGFENFPPLENNYGKITTQANVITLLSSKIRSIDTGAPLLAFVENQDGRTGYLLGENSWKWRMQSHVESGSYEKYDLFVDKIIQFLSSTNTKKSLVVDHESFYNSGEAIEISVQYFNKNYEFDEKARLTITVINTITKKSKNYDLLRSNSDFKVNLDGLSAGKYNFMVKELNSKASYSSKFEIIAFDIEKQFVNPDVSKLNLLASKTSGKAYYPEQVDKLIEALLQDEGYKTIQKNNVSRSPLIDWYWLLVLIGSLLSIEWFVRKYNGLL
jgi:hypothetical protein